MNHRKKVDGLIAELEKRGISGQTVAPPLFRLLWKYGIDIPPPLFMSFCGNAALMGILFAIPFGALAAAFIVPMWFLMPEKTLAIPALFATLLAGFLFGLAMATYNRYKAKHLQLPAWDKYSGD